MTGGEDRPPGPGIATRGLLILAIGLCAFAAVWAAQEQSPPGPTEERSKVPGAGPTRDTEPGPPADPDGPACPLAAEGEPLVALHQASEKNAVFLATRDAAWAKGTNAVWCTALEMAWRELGRLVGGELQVREAPPIALGLARAGVVELPPRSAWGRAGRRTAEELEAARTDLCRAFPRALNLWKPIPAGEGLFSVAYMEAAFQFREPFAEIDEEHHFFSGADVGSTVRAFGIPKGVSRQLETLRKQVAILYDARRFPHEDIARRDGQVARRPDPLAAPELVLDLDRLSNPLQLIVARIDRKPTLAATWAEVALLIDHAAETSPGDRPSLDGCDTLRIPAMHWDLEHDYGELAGLRITNRGFEDQSIDRVYQRTRFRLDHKGVDMSSIASITTRGVSSHYVFESPYLIALRKRGAADPFFLMYVEDASLLTPHQE